MASTTDDDTSKLSLERLLEIELADLIDEDDLLTNGSRSGIYVSELLSAPTGENISTSSLDEISSEFKDGLDELLWHSSTLDEGKMTMEARDVREEENDSEVKRHHVHHHQLLSALLHPSPSVSESEGAYASVSTSPTVIIPVRISVNISESITDHRTRDEVTEVLELIVNAVEQVEFARPLHACRPSCHIVDSSMSSSSSVAYVEPSFEIEEDLAEFSIEPESPIKSDFSELDYLRKMHILYQSNTVEVCQRLLSDNDDACEDELTKYEIERERRRLWRAQEVIRIRKSNSAVSCVLRKLSTFFNMNNYLTFIFT
jgi:hypothetical protein